MIRFDILTLFPDMFQSPLASSVLKKAIDRGVIRVSVFNIRDFTTDKHRVVWRALSSSNPPTVHRG
jgi:tRNA (guanine37-N1)-methyltransferase